MIAFDAATSQDVTTASNTLSHVCSGLNRVLVVYTELNNSFTVSGVTYNGVPMTEGVAQTDSNIGTIQKLWYLINPASGTHDIVASSDNTGNVFRIAGISLTGCHQSSQPDGTGMGQANSAAASASITTTFPNSFIIDGLRLNGDRTVTPVAGQTLRWDEPATPRSFGTSKPTTTAGANSTGATWVSSVNWTLINIGIRDLTNAYSLGIGQGSFTVTGFTSILSRGYRAILSFGSYILSGQIVTFILTRSWSNQSKNTSSYNNQSKNSSSYNNDSKNTSNYTNQSKN